MDFNIWIWGWGGGEVRLEEDTIQPVVFIEGRDGAPCRKRWRRKITGDQ